MKKQLNKRTNNSEIGSLMRQVIKFRDARDWSQFHNPKDVAIMLINEASEVLEHFRWIQKEELERHIMSNREEIEDEIADVFFCLLLLAYEMNVDLKKVLKRKLAKNDKKYPIEKSKGKRVKWTKL